MNYVVCRTRVADYASWRSVFDSHAEAQRAAGLELLNVLRDADDPDVVVVFMRAETEEQARAFTDGASAEEGARDSGVIGVPEAWHLSDGAARPSRGDST